jgi:hypothetical protein
MFVVFVIIVGNIFFYKLKIDLIIIYILVYNN